MKIEPLSYYSKRSQNVPTSFVREILKVASDPEIISFAGGLPNPAYFPLIELQKCVQQVFEKQGTKTLQYAATEGFLPLREFIAERYKGLYGLEVSPSQILLTNGSQQGLDLVGKLFIDPGDRVLMERPTYLGALQCFSMFQPVFEEITLEEEGVDPVELSKILVQTQPKLFYCIPNFQNPTGLQYSHKRRQEIAKVLSATSSILVEDDPYGAISFSEELIPPIYKYLPQQTILLGSFSKTVSPGLRVGWILASEEIIRRLAVMKQASDLHSANLSQHLLFQFLKTYNFDNHVAKIRAAYKAQRDVMIESIAAFFPPDVSYTKPKGGMFTWVSLPEKIQARALLERALKEKIIFVPGDSFYVTQPDLQTLRLNFSNVDRERTRQAMKKLGKLILNY
ncbi:PLP-dependent aminotransferase family protein [Pedobacter sp. SYSU D00535]|uniref:aminotransferase-like domain-containing protein n=1 Tax=Pedobacter sp. SYSU D00535 TaxID=2810308 RepID=UPI001A962044|nr:PLP-dependent aminotransferase family protein [Pedobacter sp. SYSU D00535]